MKLRIAKKILKNQQKLEYNNNQVTKAENSVNRATRRIEKLPKSAS